MKITISENNVKRGIREECAYCPTALAFFDAGYRNVRVTEEITQGEKDNKLHYFMHSKELAKEIYDFDDGFDFRPGTYEVTECSYEVAYSSPILYGNKEYIKG